MMTSSDSGFLTITISYLINKNVTYKCSIPQILQHNFLVMCHLLMNILKRLCRSYFEKKIWKNASVVPCLPIWVGARSCWTNVVGKLDYTIKSKVSFYLNFKPDICYNPSVIWFIHFTWTNCKQIFFSRHQAFKHCYRWKLGLTQNCIGKWKNSFTNFDCEWFFKTPPPLRRKHPNFFL